MSTAIAEQSLNKPHRNLSAVEKAAIIAACAVPGSVKGDIAKSFGVRPEYISRLLRDVKQVQNSANPLNDAYKPTLINESVESVRRGLRHKRDPYQAANIGVKVLTGLGVFSNHVEGHHEFVIKWQDDSDVIDVTPEQAGTPPVGASSEDAS